MRPERTRFAPSPTGMLHIGGLRTALYAYFLAKQTKGDFLLRIEDTDQSREMEGGIEHIVRTLDRVGIVADEGLVWRDGAIVERGDRGPYVQSKRLALYRAAVGMLVAQGDAYYCFCSRERLNTIRAEQQQNKQQPKYDRRCLKLSPADVHAQLQKGVPHVIRLRVPKGESYWNDVIRGPVSFSNDEMDDQVLLKSDGFPTYHLAVVVDDHAMNITTVIRGEEWISSTPKHLMLYAMLGYKAPAFAHVPLLLNPDKTKLSKRKGDVSTESYLNRGYLPHALVNFVSTLGFNPRADRELYTMDELIAEFHLRKVKKSGAVVNFEKLDWMNRQYIQVMSDAELLHAVEPLVERLPEQAERIVHVEKERITTLVELANTLEMYSEPPTFKNPHVLVWKNSDGHDAVVMLERCVTFLKEYHGAMQVDAIEASMKEWIAKEGYATGNVLWPLRVALSGQEKSASPFEYIYILGVHAAIERVQTAIQALKCSS
ncbi:glutamate--tRNA ligase [Candidatus Uhrbacteria bacterium RIFCSPHIGHO2_02_FULL_53_13]|uniref:Glutamate--tRNA ligase n=1 Tax=Candidatus Uhrbacteria bacterium RIFCSPHIGHO2_02_FULL_53_13 TaxID=1802389 RepID=A0A1F7TYM5_9BACT|nr:MAG: glutamate--tRNA ligase [Candidatus Uhrbacteria bacterium RIFCSPHIGHO2_02_FULL_53_13]